MKKILILLMISLVFTSCTSMTKHSKSFPDYFDTTTTYITYTSTQSEFSSQCQYIEKRLSYYDALFDQYHPATFSNVYTINKNAGKKAIQVDQELYDVIKTSIDRYDHVSKEVNIAFGPVLKLWHDAMEKATKNNGIGQAPTIGALKKANQYTSINNIILKKNRYIYLKKHANLDLGAVAKGYAMGQIAKGLQNKGVSSFILNGGGNVISHGKRLVKNDDASYLDACQEEYCVGIASPKDGNYNSNHEFEAVLAARNKAIVTSGDYQRYFKDARGKRYCHLISTHTLYPTTGIRSVSVITKDSALADYLSSVIYLMGYQQGKAFVDKHKDIEAIWLLENGQIKYSSHLHQGQNLYVLRHDE